jgi:hypothetical protein
MDENTSSGAVRRADEMFAVQVAATAGLRASDNVRVYPKVVASTETQKATVGGFNSHNLAQAVNRLVGKRSFNIPAADMMGMVTSRTVANRGFAA